MKIDKLMSDAAILAQLGERLARRRINMQLTQASLAYEAGVSKRTVERIEAGASTQTASLIRICRVLDLIDALDKFIPEVGLRPMDLIKIKGKTRQRASSGRKDDGPADQQWTWKK
jgi:transcriptional regulator with XRE-family HTH domain